MPREKNILEIADCCESAADLSLKADMTLSDLFNTARALVFFLGFRTMEFRGQEYLHSTWANFSSFEIVMMNSQPSATLYTQEEKPEPWSWNRFL